MDGDGYTSDYDCDDNNSNIYPGNSYDDYDYCGDGIDNDCDGSIDEGYDYYACNGGGYTDNDGDGYTSDYDCDDNNSNVYPGNSYDDYDYCGDGVDNDCDGSIDEGYDYYACNGYVDNDGDGYDELSDCDDTNFDINPGVTEICDGIDNNCNSLVDEGLSTSVYYIDNDGDGYGSGSAGDFCSDPGINYSTSNDDCNDDDPAINPGALDIPNNLIDENCDGSDLTNALDENLLNNTFKIYPNPGTDKFFISSENLEKGNSKLKIIDINGRVVFESDLNITQNYFMEISTIDFTKGVYQIVIYSQKQVFRGNWVKN